MKTFEFYHMLNNRNFVLTLFKIIFLVFLILFYRIYNLFDKVNTTGGDSNLPIPSPPKSTKQFPVHLNVIYKEYI